MPVSRAGVVVLEDEAVVLDGVAGGSVEGREDIRAVLKCDDVSGRDAGVRNDLREEESVSGRGERRGEGGRTHLLQRKFVGANVDRLVRYHEHLLLVLAALPRRDDVLLGRREQRPSRDLHLPFADDLPARRLDGLLPNLRKSQKLAGIRGLESLGKLLEGVRVDAEEVVDRSLLEEVDRR